MPNMLYLVLGALCTVIAVLALKLYLLQKGIKEINSELKDILGQDTNRQITLSSRDRHIRRLAAGLNQQLQQLRRQQLKYINGDRELKESVTNISHDLRTPLTAISGYLELLEREEHSAETLRCLGVIRNRTDHIKQLTEELFRYSLALSVPESTPQPLSLNRQLEESLLSFYEALSKRKITPTISMPEAPVMRTLDSTALSRIFQNILSNAVKYSSGDLTVSLTEDGSVTFSNTAPELDSLVVEQLFNRYYTVETVTSPGSNSSTGLGLSIARLLTERLGGEIHASYQKKRLEIIVRFPASAP